MIPQYIVKNALNTLMSLRVELESGLLWAPNTPITDYYLNEKMNMLGDDLEIIKRSGHVVAEDTRESRIAWLSQEIKAQEARIDIMLKELSQLAEDPQLVGGDVRTLRQSVEDYDFVADDLAFDADRESR